MGHPNDITPPGPDRFSPENAPEDCVCWSSRKIDDACWELKSCDWAEVEDEILLSIETSCFHCGNVKTFIGEFKPKSII